MTPSELQRVRQRWSRERRVYRLLEMIPGLLVWSTFGLIIFLAFFKPIVAILFIIVFDLYWLLRIIYLIIYLLVAYGRYRRAVAVDWASRLQTVSGWDRLYHLIIVPTYRESLAVLDSTFRALAKSNYPRRDRLLVVLAIEERDRVNAQAHAAALRERYGDQFGLFLVTQHPATIPGELAGKGANTAWAGRRAKEWIDERGIPYEDIIVSAFDSDTQPSRPFFSYLSWVYLTTPNRLRTSYQPLPFFHNNVWQAPAITRILAGATTFWLMTETLRPERLFTFSSHSMPFRALVDVDFWQSDIVTDDSRIFVQCLVRYDGDYRVTPLSLPLSMDTVLGPTLWQTMKNQYQQYRRWAYGVENFPFMVWNFVVNHAMPWRVKVRYVWNQLEGVYSWATVPVVIFIFGWIPLHVPSEVVQSSALAQNAPIVISWLARVAMIGLVVNALIAQSLLPPRPASVPRWRAALVLLEWALFPLTMILFGSVPATDAQTRLMLGKYLGFWVTPKARKA